MRPDFMKNKPWLSKISENEMPNEDLRLVASLCGVHIAVALMEQLAGININIPKRSFMLLKKKYILENYDGTALSVKKIALECDISQRYVYMVLNSKRK